MGVLVHQKTCHLKIWHPPLPRWLWLQILLVVCSPKRQRPPGPIEAVACSVLSGVCAQGIDSSANWMRNCSTFSLRGSSMHLCQRWFTFWDWTHLFPVCFWLQTSGSSALLPCVWNSVSSFSFPPPSSANHIWEQRGLAGSVRCDSGT